MAEPAPLSKLLLLIACSTVAWSQAAKPESGKQVVIVTAPVPQPTVEQPDPSQRVLVREEVLDANPGRPGAPVSIPGLPIETASGGIKAPQYFAPGVAGDHGEPIATFFQIGDYLVPNNLSANAHGNGYSDPNPLIPSIIEAVETDGGAFNVREGNHSVDLAETYLLRPAMQPFMGLTFDAHDADLTAGWNWLSVGASYGDGFLQDPERRRQFKLNAVKGWTLGPPFAFRAVSRILRSVQNPRPGSHRRA